MSIPEHLLEEAEEVVEAAREFIHQWQHGRYQDIPKARQALERAVDEYEKELGDDGTD